MTDKEIVREIIKKELNEPGYVYHGTSQGAFRRIKKEGLKSKQPIFFSSLESYSETYASRKDFTGGVVLRTKLTDDMIAAENIQADDAYTEYYTNKTIFPSNLEIKLNGKWIFVDAID